MYIYIDSPRFIHIYIYIGLVFPSFMSSPGEMLCAGILPVNQMRDYIEPAYVISSRVPMHLLEAAYGMKIRYLLNPYPLNPYPLNPYPLNPYFLTYLHYKVRVPEKVPSYYHHPHHHYHHHQHHHHHYHHH
jgi:hypothetical protein